MERCKRLWNMWVNQDAREFMEYSRSSDPREAVREYLTHLDQMFGPGTIETAPDDLEDALVAYIENEVRK